MMQPAIAPRRLPLPEWLPSQVRDNLAGRSVSVKLPQSVKRRLRTPEKIKVSQHAEKHRTVTDGPHVGPWRHEHAPHTVRIMDTFCQPWVREVWFCGVEQSGKTNTMLNCMAWCIDCDPGNIFYLMPTEDAANKVVGKKIKPMLQQSPRLAGYLTDRKDDVTLSMISLNHGVTIFPAHANSATAMATWSAKHCFGDEVDKYPEMAGKEADPITLIKKRNRTYKGRYKRMFGSSPAGRFIYAGMQKCHQAWEFRERCPECGELIKMAAEHLVVKDDATPESVEVDGAGYACNHCGIVWSEQMREQAIKSGCWLCVKGEELTRPARVGFHHRAWDCLDVPLAEIAASWLKAKTGDTADKVAWANGYEAIDYEAEVNDRPEEMIKRLVDPSMPRRVVPRDPSAIVMKVDTQQIGFHYEVWAFGWGRDLEVWMIDHGYVEHFANLVDIAGRELQDADGKTYRAQAGFIDSGGGTNPFKPKHSRTAEVYEFCRLHPFFRPLKGRREQAQPWTTSKIDFYPSRSGKKVPIPGGLVLYLINVTMYKDELARKLQVEMGDPGGIHLHAETGDDYVKQMCAEYKDERGWWHCPRQKDNHHWDLGVYGLAAADILGLRNRTKPKEDNAPRRRIINRGVQK